MAFLVFKLVVYLSLVFLDVLAADDIFDYLQDVALLDDVTMTNSKLTAEEFVSYHSSAGLSSDFILSLYRTLQQGKSLSEVINTGRSNHQLNLQHADTIRAFTPNGKYESHDMHIYRFNLSLLAQSEILQGAELHFQLPTCWSNLREVYAVGVAQANDGTGLKFTSSIPILIPSAINPGLKATDVTIPVGEWLAGYASGDHNKPTFDLTVGRKDPDDSFSRSKLLRKLENFYETMAFETEIMPDIMLVTYSESSKDAINASEVYTHLDRVRRDADVNSLKSGGSCHRRDLRVDFHGLGWDEWVAFPSKFNAYQCYGKCGGFTDTSHNPTNHAIVQNLVRTVKKYEIPVPCCAPTKLSPISMLYYEGQTVTLKNHGDMIVDKCGCL
ncbi:hypothetical protein CHUAL_007497 [Chamberlinius hualienensis]